MQWLFPICILFSDLKKKNEKEKTRNHHFPVSLIWSLTLSVRAILLHVSLPPREECLCPVGSTFQTNTPLGNLGCKCQQTSFNFMGHLHWCSGMTPSNTHHFSDWPCSSENMQLKRSFSNLSCSQRHRVMRRSPAPSGAADTCCTLAATSAQFCYPETFMPVVKLVSLHISIDLICTKSGIGV